VKQWQFVVGSFVLAMAPVFVAAIITGSKCVEKRLRWIQPSILAALGNARH